MDAGQFAPGDRQVARAARPARQKHGVEAALKIGERQVDADHHPGFEGDPFRGHLRQAAVENALLELKVRDAVAQDAADARLALEHGHLVSRPGQLLRRRQARRTAADDGDAATALDGRGFRLDPAFAPAFLYDGQLELPDGHRLLVEVQRAGGLAGSRTDPSGDLGEVVGAMQQRQRLAPMAAVGQIIEVWDEIAQRAAVSMAEGNAAVHATTSLLLQMFKTLWFVNFAPILDAHIYRTTSWYLAWCCDETLWISQELPPP